MSDAPEELPQDLPEGASKRLAELEQGLFTSDLSVNEFLLIKEVGFHPVGFVMGSSIYHTGSRPGGGARARSSPNSPRPCTTPGSWP